MLLGGSGGMPPPGKFRSSEIVSGAVSGKIAGVGDPSS